MRSPNISCKIEILSSINSSEDPKKIETAILNIFPNAKIKIDDFSIQQQVAIIGAAAALVLISKTLFSSGILKVKIGSFIGFCVWNRRILALPTFIDTVLQH